MKTFYKTLISLSLVLPAFAMAGAIREAAVPVDHIFTPAGFDSNDNVEIVVTGYLPNLCYKAPKSTVEVKEGKIEVTVKAIKNPLDMSLCPAMIVPYIEYINVGVLDKGKYKVAVNENSNWEKISSLYIAEATSSAIDEVVYANVDEVVRKSLTNRKVVLKGYNPSDCFELKEIAVLDNGEDTYSILPRMKQIRDFCPKKMIPFTYEFDVPEKLEADKVLLHVRVMDGRSVNAFFFNKPYLE